MIVYLEGILKNKDNGHIVLLTQGVGYQVFLSKPDLEQLPEIGSDLSLHIHMIIREDSHLLFGFSQASEKSIFLKLIQVNSIGPKVALNILSGLPAGELAQAIHTEDLVSLTAIPGIGKKTAERMVVDLKDKILELLGSTPLPTGFKKVSSLESIPEEALSALVNLGYSRHEAQRGLQSVPEASELSLEALVREGLKALS